MRTRFNRFQWRPFFLLMGLVLLTARPASALTVAYVMNNITYSNTTFPYTVSTGNGMFAWTYNAGNFQNGTGQYLFVNLPTGTVYPSPSYGPIYTVDAAMLTGTITQNVDTYWYDYSLNYSPALTSPNSLANITGGSYDLYLYNNFVGGETMGTVIGGTVTPYKPILTVKISGTNVVVNWPTNYADGFVLESTTSLKPGNLWTTSSIPVHVLGQNYLVTNNATLGTNLFFRLIR